jgi:2-oxo-4-hydroxy-4-carboxy-5-ureidoimidazoline decarboxylase
MTLAELNATDCESFVAALGWVFEDSAWVAERASARRPFSTLDEVHAAMISAVKSASIDEQLALLRAHPDLGVLRLNADGADERRQAGPPVSLASHREQTGAGFDALTRDELARLRTLNAAYREKFGFPFLFAVKGSTTQDILAALERRLTSTRDTEHEEALRQVYRIARFRLEELIS